MCSHIVCPSLLLFLLPSSFYQLFSIPLVFSLFGSPAFYLSPFSLDSFLNLSSLNLVSFSSSSSLFVYHLCHVRSLFSVILPFLFFCLYPDLHPCSFSLSQLFLVTFSLGSTLFNLFTFNVSMYPSLFLVSLICLCLILDTFS